jgi:hypothetical protein
MCSTTRFCFLVQNCSFEILVLNRERISIVTFEPLDVRLNRFNLAILFLVLRLLHCHVSHEYLATAVLLDERDWGAWEFVKGGHL